MAPPDPLPDGLNRIPWFSVNRPITVVTAFLVILVVGALATFRIPIQMMPSGWDLPNLWIWVPYRDGTPVETETRVVRPLEEQLSTVPGIKRLNANASASNASLSLEFHGSVDMDDAYNAVADRVERARADLPEDVQQVYIWRFNPNDEPVIWAGISVPEGDPELYFKTTRILQRRLQRIPGVGRVDLWGVAEPLVAVEFRRDALLAHGVDLTLLVGRLASDNFQLASGDIVERGSVRLVRSLARFEGLDALRRYPVAPGVVLADVADIIEGASASQDINRIDGRPGAAFGVNKESSANTIEVCRELKRELAALEQDPRLKGYQFPVFFDQGALIEESLGALVEAALEGGVLAVLVLIIFLREWRITALITATIPASLLLTMIVLYFRGDTLNLLSMLGLMLAVGMVVDNAVVVVEAIYRRRQLGESPRQAAILGTGEMLLPITLSTLTAIVVFLPIILMSDDGTTSFFLQQIGLPVVFIQVGSLLITLLFTPLSTVWLGSSEVPADPAWLVTLANWVDRGLVLMLTRPVDTFMGVLATGLLTVAVPLTAVDCSDNMDGGLNDFDIRYTVPRSLTYYERLAVVEQIEGVVAQHREDWQVRVFVSRIQSSSARGQTTVYLRDGSRPREELLDHVRAALPEIPGVTVQIGYGEDERTEHFIQVKLWGEDTSVLANLAAEAERRIQSVPGVLGVASAVETDGTPEMRLWVDRDATARHGVRADVIGQVVSFAMRGVPLPSWYRGEREIQVRSRFRPEDQQRVERLLGLQVGSATGLVPIGALVHAEPGKGWGSIRRENRQTAMALRVDLEPDLKKEDAYLQVEAALAGIDWPRGYGSRRGDAWQEALEDQRKQLLAVILSIVFVFLIMGVLFESFLLPMTVITTVPMAALGVWWGLWLTGTAFDGMAAVGIIVLVGIVVNNGIVLVDTITEQRNQGVERAQALRTAVRTRLRPVLMTALTAMVGVIPMATGDSTFVGIPYAPLGRVVLSGMVVATVLTLFFVPFLYAVLDDARHAGSRWFAWVWPRSAR